MKKYRVEFAFAENFCSVQEWQTMDGLDRIDAENAGDAAKWAACTDGLADALFQVYELESNGRGVLEPASRHNPDRFYFGD